VDPSTACMPHRAAEAGRSNEPRRGAGGLPVGIACRMAQRRTRCGG
jgi:hypothetical protein